MKKKKYNIIGITGPTGSGKTTVSIILKDFGCAIVNADKITRKIYKNSKCIKKIKKAFGNEVLNTDGNINRKVLAEFVFHSQEKLDKLNKITHPIILKEAKKIFNNLYKKGYSNIIFDAPTLIESNFHKECDIVITVITPIELRRKRIISRDNLTEKEANARIFAQPSDTYYISHSDITINNDYNEDNLVRQIKYKIFPFLM